MTFHVRLAWRNWMAVQLGSGETESINPPDFGAGLTMFEMQNNLMWLPSVTNVPLLLNLSPPQSRPRSSACHCSATSNSAGISTFRMNSPGGTRGSSRSRQCCAEPGPKRPVHGQHSVRRERSYSTSQHGHPFGSPPPHDAYSEWCHGAYVCVVAWEGKV
jgi:hypothetical protein